MTSSSFGTIVGKERDKIPGYGVQNYAETEPDLTDEVNEQITRNQQDTVDFYTEMANIQRELAERPLQNLESLATFSRSASQAIQTFRDRQEAQDKINEAMDFLDRNSTAELYTKEGTLELENAKFDNQLLNENTEASLNFLRARNVPVPEDVSTKELLRLLNQNMFGARQQFINENGGQDIIDSETFIELHNAADELMITAMLRKARSLGIDTNSREFRKTFYNTIYPDIKQRRENNIQSWKGNANRNFKKINKEKTRDIIVKTLEPYSENAKFDVDVMTLVETVKNRIPEVETNRDAIEYIFTEVAAETAETERRLNLEHLEYLFDGAIFEHSATGVKSTIADGDFNFKDTLNNIMQSAEVDRAREVDNNIRADKILANQEYGALKDQYPNGIPPQIETQFLRDLETKYPHFDATNDLDSSTAGISGGGEYPNAGQPDGNYNYKADLTAALVGEETPNRDEFFEIERAYGDFTRRVKNQVDVGVDPETAQNNAYQVVEDNLKARKYKDKLTPRSISPADILADNELLRGDTNKTRFNDQTNSLAERIALSEYKAHKLYGEPFPTYFKGVVNGTKISAIDYAEDRFASTGGYNSIGEIAQRFTPNENGILVDKQYGLSKEELNEFEVKPHLTKTNTKLLQDPELAEKVLIGFRKDGNELGTYQPAIGFGRKNGDKLTVGQVIELAGRGGSNWGIYGFSSQEIMEATKSGVIKKDALFNEETQSQMVFELLRQRSNRTNSIRGAIIQAKKGGEETIFEGDEDIGRWDRLVDMDANEIRATLNTFPMLRDMPMNQFQNLTAGVILNIEKIIKEEEAKETGEQKIARIDRQLEYYNDLLGKVTEGDRGFLGTRILTKAASRFFLPRPEIEKIIKDLEAEKAEIEKLRTND